MGKCWILYMARFDRRNVMKIWSISMPDFARDVENNTSMYTTDPTQFGTAQLLRLRSMQWSLSIIESCPNSLVILDKPG